MKTKKIVALAMFAAISIVLILVPFLHFMIFPQTPFLEYDMADIPIFIATFVFGPLSGLAVVIVVSLIQGLTVSASGGIVGILMHIFATGSFVLVSGLIYYRNKTRRGAYIALTWGVVTMTLTMTAWNLLITPFYLGVPMSAVTKILPFIVFFNIIKAGINSLLTALLYKRVHGFIRRNMKA